MKKIAIGFIVLLNYIQFAKSMDKENNIPLAKIESFQFKKNTSTGEISITVDTDSEGGNTTDSYPSYGKNITYKHRQDPTSKKTIYEVESLGEDDTSNHPADEIKSIPRDFRLVESDLEPALKKAKSAYIAAAGMVYKTTAKLQAKSLELSFNKQLQAVTSTEHAQHETNYFKPMDAKLANIIKSCQDLNNTSADFNNALQEIKIENARNKKLMFTTLGLNGLILGAIITNLILTSVNAQNNP